MNTLPTQQTKEKILKVAGHTDSKKLSDSIISSYNDSDTSKVTLRTIGAASLNQAMKGVIIANKYFVNKGILLVIKPAFQDLFKKDIFPNCEEGDTSKITAIELRIQYERI